MRPVLSYPAAQIVNSASLGPLSTTATAVQLPVTSSGNKPSWVRIAISTGAAHFRLQSGTSTTAVTSDLIVTSSEALWLNTYGLNGLSARQTVGSAGTAGAAVSIGACEEGVVAPATVNSVVG